jgi:Ca-activated chloride channel homolog
VFLRTISDTSGKPFLQLHLGHIRSALISKRILYSVLSMGLFALASFGAEPITTIHASVNEVRVTVIATDSSGRPVSNLSPRELLVFDDGHPVSHFDLHPAADLPLSLVIVFDLSDSMHKVWPMLRSSLSVPLRQMLRAEDQVVVMAFDHKIELDRTINLPSEFNALELPQPGGLTALYDTLYLACKKRMLTDPADPRQSTLIVFSDGEDNLSRHDLEDVTESAESAGIAIYSISSHSHRLYTDGDVALHRLAVATGGRSFVAANPSELKAALAIIQGELRSSYLLYYPLQEQPGPRKFRFIQLVPTSQPGPTLRCRAGYYISQ